MSVPVALGLHLVLADFHFHGHVVIPCWGVQLQFCDDLGCRVSFQVLTGYLYNLLGNICPNILATFYGVVCIVY